MNASPAGRASAEHHTGGDLMTYRASRRRLDSDRHEDAPARVLCNHFSGRLIYRV